MYSVYVVKPDGLKSHGKFVKIGYTSDINRRLKQFNTGSPYPFKVLHLIPCRSQAHALHIEQLLLKEFAALRTQGEWIKATQNFFNYVVALKEGDHIRMERALQKHLTQLHRGDFDWKVKQYKVRGRKPSQKSKKQKRQDKLDHEALLAEQQRIYDEIMALASTNE